jgi:hypothetical protein
MDTLKIKQYIPVYHTTNFYPHLFRIHSPMKMEQTQCSELSAIKHLTPKNNPKDYTRHSEHGGSLKSRINILISSYCIDKNCTCKIIIFYPIIHTYN